jgi:phospholipid/cholesterol/gamma-HCH transport system substrate-binding protein
MPAKKHDFTATEIKAGATVAASLAVLALFGVTVLGLRPSPIENRFFTDFSDTMGLNVGADVRFGGFKVGRVIGIATCSEDRSKLRVTWTAAKAIPVNTESRASVSYISLVSDMHLEVSTGTKAEPALVPDGSMVPSATTAGGMLGGIKDLAANVGEALGDNGILGDLRKFLGVKQALASPDKPFVPVAQLIADTDKIVAEGTTLVGDVRGTVATNSKRLEEILGKLEEIGGSAKDLVDHLDAVLAENRGDIRQSIAGTRDIVATASGTLADLEKAAASLESLLRDAGGFSANANGMLAESRPEIEAAIADLRDTVRNLRRFARILAEEPHALIRGKSPEGRD